MSSSLFSTFAVGKFSFPQMKMKFVLQLASSNLFLDFVHLGYARTKLLEPMGKGLDRGGNLSSETEKRSNFSRSTNSFFPSSFFFFRFLSLFWHYLSFLSRDNDLCHQESHAHISQDEPEENENSDFGTTFRKNW